MIDYGLMALIVVVLALVGLTFHAWRGVKAEILALSAIRAQAETCIAMVKAVELRQTETEKVPAQLKARLDAFAGIMTDLEAKQVATGKDMATAKSNILSLNGRLARSKSKRNRVIEEEEQDPAAEAEGESGDLRDAMPPGSFSPHQEQPHIAPIPARFGVVARKVSNG